VDEIVLNSWEWYTDNHITLHAGKKVVEVDRVKRIVRAVDSQGGVTEAAYDRLLMCTGSNPFMLPVPGKDLKGVIAYRDIADTDYMIETARTHKHAVVIGGGLLGLEAANGLMLRGMSVTVVHVMPWLMERQLDDVAGKLLQKSLEDRGLKFLIGAQTQELVGGDDGRVKAIRFKDGTEVAADLVVMAVGIRPNVELAEQMRLHCNRGIVVNDTMQTVTDARIYSVGECAAHRGIAYGLVAPLFEQAKVAANHLAQFGIGRYLGSLTSTKLKVTGIDLFSAGEFMGGEGTEEIVMSDPFGGVYKKLVIKDDKLVGACLYGDTVDGSWYFKLLRDGPQRARHPRQADVRRIQHRRHRPRGPQQGRQHARRGRGLRLQRRDQGHHLQGDQGQGPVHPGRGARSTPRPAPAAARAPGWWSRS
jgi:nitrite reductase (NADH) large subunit